MSIEKFLNLKYNSNVPYRTGDRYYAQDRTRDVRFLQDSIGLLMKDVWNDVPVPFVVSGGMVTQGTGDTLDIELGVGWAKFSVEIPDTFAGTPPSKKSEDLEGVRVAWTAQTDMAIASATLNGSTTNYVKVAYQEDNGDTRTRAKATGSYAYENEPSFLITVNSTAPTDYEILLATFTGSVGGTFTIDNSVRTIYGVKNEIKKLKESFVSTWTIRTSAADNSWFGVAYGNGVFVAVSTDGTGNRVMTSPDGITWTIRTSATNNIWNDVTYGDGLFVAVSSSGTGNRVMTSPDGITWTIRTSAANNTWRSVTYGDGLFVAVSETGSGNRVMTSPDGITWTIRTSAADNIWGYITYGNGVFVAVSLDGIGNRVMTSPDGITWTIRTSAADNQWRSVTYGNGLFVAVSGSGSGNRVMTSPDGITWTIRTSAADNTWISITYGNGLFVAVSISGTGNRVMTSPDGITWTTRTSATNNNWRSVTYGNGLFVAVSYTGTGNRVMTSLQMAV